MDKLVNIRGIEGYLSSKLISGNMYYFKYKAKTSNIVYDVYPLIFVTKRIGTLIEGINFHYFDNQLRMKIFNSLTPFLSENQLTSDTRLLVKAYRKIILVSKKQRLAKISFHRYRLKRVRSEILRIPPNKWKESIPMNMEQFKTSAGKMVKSNIIFRESMLKSIGRM
jgi:hypothetical protein